MPDMAWRRRALEKRTTAGLTPLAGPPGALHGRQDGQKIAQDAGLVLGRPPGVWPPSGDCLTRVRQNSRLPT
eukprot:7655638-Pyramimonas_sp.AAC.1